MMFGPQTLLVKYCHQGKRLRKLDLEKTRKEQTQAQGTPTSCVVEEQRVYKDLEKQERFTNTNAKTLKTAEETTG